MKCLVAVVCLFQAVQVLARNDGKLRYSARCQASDLQEAFANLYQAFDDAKGPLLKNIANIVTDFAPLFKSRTYIQELTDVAVEVIEQGRELILHGAAILEAMPVKIVEVASDIVTLLLDIKSRNKTLFDDLIIILRKRLGVDFKRLKQVLGLGVFPDNQLEDEMKMLDRLVDNFEKKHQDGLASIAEEIETVPYTLHARLVKPFWRVAVRFTDRFDPLLKATLDLIALLTYNLPSDIGKEIRQGLPEFREIVNDTKLKIQADYQSGE